MTPTAMRVFAPADVHPTLGRTILADGLDLVFDYDKSHGSWLHDSRSGREYLDFLTFFGSNPIGFNHPRMLDPEFVRVLNRVAQLKPALSDLYTVEYAWFVDTLRRLAMPPHLVHAFFIEGGALANENAMKIAFDWKVRRNLAKGVPGTKGQQIVHFREAFHGRSGYTLSVTNTDPVKTDYFPKFPWPRIENPKLRFPVTPEVERDVAAAEERAVEQIRRAFTDNPDDIAAVLLEPIQAEGGDNHFRPSFLRTLQALCHEYGCLFVLDEVQTGIGITGKMWAHEHWDLRPDVIAFGKKTQVCGCLAGPRVDEEPDNVFRVGSRINSTWGGGLTDMVRFARYLEVIEEERLVDNARVIGERLVRGLEEIQAGTDGLMTNARGLGLMIAFDLPDGETRTRVHRQLVENGLLLLTCGPRSIRFRPSLNLTAADADAALDIVRRTVRRQ